MKPDTGHADRDVSGAAAPSSIPPKPQKTSRLLAAILLLVAVPIALILLANWLLSHSGWM